MDLYDLIFLVFGILEIFLFVILFIGLIIYLYEEHKFKKEFKEIGKENENETNK